jgi:hypothetical protein
MSPMRDKSPAPFAIVSGVEYQGPQDLCLAMSKTSAALAASEARVSELEADNERLRGAFDDEDETASVHWYGEWVGEKRARVAAESQGAELSALLGELQRAEHGLGRLGCDA